MVIDMEKAHILILVEVSIIGEFKNGLQHGEGTNTFNDGGKEVGEYFEGEPWNINGFDEDGNIFYSYVNGKEQE